MFYCFPNFILSPSGIQPLSFALPWILTLSHFRIVWILTVAFNPTASYALSKFYFYNLFYTYCMLIHNKLKIILVFVIGFKIPNFNFFYNLNLSSHETSCLSFKKIGLLCNSWYYQYYYVFIVRHTSVQFLFRSPLVLSLIHI